MSVPHHRTTEQPANTGRRSLLRVSGLAGLVVAGSAVTTGTAQAAPTTSGPGVLHADTVDDLRALNTKTLSDGTQLLLAGYHRAGDGGAMALRWNKNSTAPHNGGTVIAPENPGNKNPGNKPGKGRWHQLHTGVLDFRTFGHFDTTHPADTALDAMIDDPTVHRIEAHTDLHFQKRHLWNRSNIELDFGGHHITTTGIEKNTHDNPFGAVLSFRGTVTTTTVTHKLGADMPDLSDLFEVGDSGKFAVGQWWAVEVNALSGTYEKEIQRLVQVTDVVDATHIRVNYQIGWDLAAGRTLTWTRIEPVDRAHVRNLVFEGWGDDEMTGSHPVSYEYAVRCDVSGIEATGTFWPVIMRRWCTYYRTEQCSLTNPKDVTYGGAGYLTQQIYCLYGHVEDCHTSNARHLNDFTASAYCYVTNCHGDGDDQGPFVTHGQFEHDLVYTGNSGLMTFANSGAAWGGAAKRITVRRHACSWFVARVNVTDLTLEDMLVIGKKSLDGSGMLWVNADGVQIRGCTASGPLIVSQASKLSGRPNVIADSNFSFAAGAEITQGNVSAPLTLQRTVLDGVGAAVFNGTGPLVLDQCTLTGAEDAAPVSLAHPDITVDGGELRDTGLKLTSSKDQRLRVDGARVGGTNKDGALLSRTGSARTVDWQLNGVTSTAPKGTAHLLVTEGANRYRATGSTFTGGRLELRPAAFTGADSHLLHTGCVEDGTERTALPDEGARVSHTAATLRF
ncbi:peptidase C14 [Streptomyces sp. NBC_01766]|uniref:peptidase C14 n=1 Tax=Streptomyces sp. NBC_01766 TaxID=2975936 RepID=UPI002DD926C6|nr:peptidase C14 [Streptomyces sp. NBC_01766]WSC23651.1 peptidase C14 [Streptomyces sp. NBC_01766]